MSVSTTIESAVNARKQAADELILDSNLRMSRMEIQLIWIRRTALIAWGLVLYFESGFQTVNLNYLIYFGCMIYMEVLHYHLRRQKNMHIVRRIAVAGDSILAFIMCILHGGLNSVFIPHFYLTIMAAAFRFGSRESNFILLLNFLLFAVLVTVETLNAFFPVNAIFVAQYMIVAFFLGKILADWARINLRVAMDHAKALEVERDRSNALLRRLIDIQEEERKLLSNELHDRMGESLFSIGHGLDACIEECQTLGTPPHLRQVLSDVRHQLTRCTTFVRFFLNELRPNVLDELGLREALNENIDSLQQIVPFQISLQWDPNLAQWRSRQDAMLFRLIQEAILNCRKHAAASNVTISLDRNPKGEVVLEIIDDGKGFSNSATHTGHYGLLMMSERAVASGGTLEIESAYGSGTRIIVVFPATTEEQL